MKRLTILGLSLILVLVVGCQPTSYFLYLIAPVMPDKTEEAEYKGLPNSTVAVVVFVEPAILYDYPNLREQISNVVGYQLTKNVDKVKAVEGERVTRFQDDHADWEGMDKTALGKKFGADFVLNISVVTFSTLEPGSTYLHRGFLTAQVTLHKCSLPEKEACVWNGGEIQIKYPEKDTTMGDLNGDDREIRNQTILSFAELLAKKFYKHKLPKEDEVGGEEKK
jgi:hypothetical protein